MSLVLPLLRILAFALLFAVLLFASLRLSIRYAGTLYTNPYFQNGKAHHTEKGFSNVGAPTVDKKFSDLLRWRMEKIQSQLFGGKPKQLWRENQAIATQRLDLPRLMQNNPEEIRYTWLGHSSSLLQIAGLNILTDPVFSNRASPLENFGPARQIPHIADTEHLPPIDAVLISHNHYDHLDIPTLKKLKGRSGNAPIFLVPLGSERTLEKHGIRTARAMDWWDAHHLSPQLSAHFVPAQHWSARSLWDRNRDLWGGWVIQTKGFRYYFSGDTGFNAQLFANIAERFAPIDFANIAVGAYEPRWFMQQQHINPDEAVQIHRILGVKKSLGVHWGTFSLTDEPLNQPEVDLPAALAKYSVDPAAFTLPSAGATIVVGK